MRRILSLTAVLLVLTQALAAAVPMLHQPEPPKATHAHGKHDCCPKAVVEVRDCCTRIVACPHQRHSAGACCCVESGDTAVPARKTISNANPAMAGIVATLPGESTSQDWSPAAALGSPPDNSPLVLVLRN